MPTAGILQFSKPIYRITESGEWLTERVQVLRTDGAAGNVSVKITAKTETATVGKDIEKISQVLTWTDGDATPKFVDIKPIQDMYTEGEEFTTLSLSSIKGAKYASVKTAQLVITEKVNIALQNPSDSLIILVHNENQPHIPIGVKLSDLKQFLIPVIPQGQILCTDYSPINGAGKIYEFNVNKSTEVELTIQVSPQLQITPGANSIIVHRWNQKPNYQQYGKEEPAIVKLTESGGQVRFNITPEYKWIHFGCRNPLKDNIYDVPFFTINGFTVNLLRYD